MMCPNYRLILSFIATTRRNILAVGYGPHARAQCLNLNMSWESPPPPPRSFPSRLYLWRRHVTVFFRLEHQRIAEVVSPTLERQHWDAGVATR